MQENSGLISGTLGVGVRSLLTTVCRRSTDNSSTDIIPRTHMSSGCRFSRKLMPSTYFFFSHVDIKKPCRFYINLYNYINLQGGICRGKPWNFPLTGSDLPSHWFVWKLRGNGKGEGRERGKGRVGRSPALLPPHWLLPQIPPWLISIRSKIQQTIENKRKKGKTTY